MSDASCLMLDGDVCDESWRPSPQKRAIPRDCRSGVVLAAVLASTSVVVLSHVACVGASRLPVPPQGPAPPASSVDRFRVGAGTECDAWFEIGGSFVFARNDLRLTLRNRSSGTQCAATRVLWLFAGPIRRGEVTITTPAAWTNHDLPCADGAGTCGVEWRATDPGVLPGQDLPGFGLQYNPLNTPPPRSWVVHVGERRVEMPIGVVGSRLGPADD